jgi:hypothetical protein
LPASAAPAEKRTKVRAINNIARESLINVLQCFCV